MRFDDFATENCSIARPATLLGERWTLLILRQAFAGIRRYEQFRETLGCSRTILSDRLHVLVEHGVLARQPYKDNRVRYEYHLTDKGLDLYPVLMAMRTWGDRHMAPDGPPVRYRHRGCGGSAVVSHECDRCEQPLSARDVEILPGPGLDAATR